MTTHPLNMIDNTPSHLHMTTSGGTPIRLAFILIPFWIIEGFAMMSSLGYMLLGFHYWRRGKYYPLNTNRVTDP